MSASNIDNLEVLYEDNHLIIVNKRSGDIVQGDKTGDMPLGEVVAAYIARRDSKPGAAFIGVTHRLDRPVSGVTIFAKTSKALERLNELFRSSEMEKRYWAIVAEKEMKNRINLISYLLKKERRKRQSFVINL